MSSGIRLPFLLLLLRFYFLNTFNLDTNSPIYKTGPDGSYFGFSVASHFRNNQPIVLIGAPRADSHQPHTTQTGAVFGCDLDFNSKSQKACQQLQIEYLNRNDSLIPPMMLGDYKLHPEGKNYQLLGFVVHSAGSKDGPAIACAPLMRYGDSAYTDGVCYVLNNDLTQNTFISTCFHLPKSDRHNEYGACEQGFSAYIDQNVILTGLPGARKWTGGVFGRYSYTDNGFPESADRYTMEVDHNHNGITNILASHDYLGYSVRHGRFGFWYEEENGSNFTIVSGATRYMQNGSVVFLPFRKKALVDEQKYLGLDANFTLIGQQLGSGFGYAIEVLDLNNDGFDDLIVSAPFEFYFNKEDEYGGAVYVYFSRGKKQARGDNHLVFHEPIILRGPDSHSQFGMALTKLGNIDNDPQNYEDFAIGAPYADEGKGAVFIYQGSTRENFRQEPSQSIYAKGLTTYTGRKPLSSFGGSLSGGVDLDSNFYGDLVVGAYDSNVAVVLRARPVIDVKLKHEMTDQNINIDGVRHCGSSYKTCFDLTTVLEVKNRNNTIQLADFNSDSFQCTIKVVPLDGNIKPRATIDRATDKYTYSWQCGKNALRREHRQTHRIMIPKTNQDWMNPLRFNFTVKMRENAMSREILPIINQFESMHSFTVDFDKQCGVDNKCETDLSVRPILRNMTQNDTTKNIYTMKVTERDSIIVRFMVENKGERAYSSKLYVKYNNDELDEPQLVVIQRSSGAENQVIDKEKVEDEYAVIALGNPLEPQAKLTFDLSFKLVRGSSERVSASLFFDVVVNSTSIEKMPEDNHWKAEVQLIKKADLEIKGVSDPVIVHFSGGSSDVGYEFDIGPQVIHRYTITNHGPFYARNVSVKIDWPLQINTDGDNKWALYILEEPVIRHNGKIRTCLLDPHIRAKAINPKEIHQDVTYSLTYGHDIQEQHKQSRGKREISEDTAELRVASIFSSRWIKPKKTTEISGAEISIIDVNCEENTAKCIPLTCHFDYVGTEESALIEIRARLWNYTFSGDYQGIEYVAISSKGHIELDPAQGIIEDLRNNFAKVTTQAYPDRPAQEMKLTWWLILLAVLIALLLLAILILILVKCGFFKRKRLGDPLLHQAEYTYQREQYSET